MESRTPSAAEASAYIAELVAAYPSIREVWLYGSRANGSARPDSDWDYMAFADAETLKALRADSRYRRDRIHLMIVTDGEHFEAPWMEGPRFEHGELSNGWHWENRSATKARYLARKGYFQPKERCALKVYP